MKGKVWRVSGITLLLAGGSLGAWVWASETIEIATYVPAPGTSGGSNFDRLHANRATIGDAYKPATVPDSAVPDGSLFVSGVVSIGRSNPTGVLHVVTPVSTDANQPRFFSDDGTPGGWNEILLGSNLNGPYRSGVIRYFNGMGVAGTSRLALFNRGDPDTSGIQIIGGGNVGIGTAGPASKLHVYDTADSTITLQKANASGISVWRYNGPAMEFGTQAHDSLQLKTNNVARIHIHADGNVGIGMTNPTFPLEVNGNWATRGDRSYLLGADNSTWYWVMVGGTTEGTDNAVGFKANARQMRFGPGWTCTNCSDLRLKKEVTPVSNALERVLTIRGVNFRWADPKLGKKLQMGVIGQEVERVFPELVSTDSNGMKWVEPAPLTAVLIEAVRELKGQNDTLRLEVKDLKQEIESLRNVSGKERAGGGPS